MSVGKKRKKKKEVEEHLVYASSATVFSLLCEKEKCKKEGNALAAGASEKGKK